MTARRCASSLTRKSLKPGVLMNQITPPPKIEIIPSSAPFSEAQRSWLNGFFAGLLSDAPTPLSAEQGAAVMQGAAGDGDDGEAPWHDQTMPIADRMKLAEGRPLRRRMMAAMAQQDCGQCGYDCHNYSEAIASKSEARLNLCVPGGKETARMLKSLYEDIDKAPAAASSAPAAHRLRLRSWRSRDVRATIPTPATFLSRRLLNKGGFGKGDLAHRVRSVRLRPRLCRRRFLRHLRAQRCRAGRPDHRAARRLPHHQGERQDAARSSDRRRLAGAGAGLAVRTDLLHHRRRHPREGEGAGAGRGPRRRRGDARRDGGAAEILRRAPAPRGLCRGAGAAAAAALFDLVVAQCDARKTVADGRLRALRDQQAQAPGPGFDLPRRTHQSRR